VLLNAVHSTHWEHADEILAALIDHCGDEAVPPNFQNTFLRMLTHLDRVGRADRVAVHIAHFVRLYPRDRALVQAFTNDAEIVAASSTSTDASDSRPGPSSRAASAGDFVRSPLAEAIALGVLIGGSVVWVLALAAGIFTRRVRRFRWFALSALWLGAMTGAAIEAWWSSGAV
jgi:hypothetical protein